MTQEQSASVLDRYGFTAEAQNNEVDLYDANAEYRAFGVSRKAWGGEPMLNFINCHGDHLAIAYSHLYTIRFNPSRGIAIEFSDHIVILRGRRLADGYHKLVMQRVVFIAEADRATEKLVSESESVVTEMLIQQKREKSLDLNALLTSSE